MSHSATGLYHFSDGDRVQRQSDGVVGRVVSSTVHYAVVRWPALGGIGDTVQEIEQLDRRYVNVQRCGT